MERMKSARHPHQLVNNNHHRLGLGAFAVACVALSAFAALLAELAVGGATRGRMAGPLSLLRDAAIGASRATTAAPGAAARTPPPRRQLADGAAMYGVTLANRDTQWVQFVPTIRRRFYFSDYSRPTPVVGHTMTTYKSTQFGVEHETSEHAYRDRILVFGGRDRTVQRTMWRLNVGVQVNGTTLFDATGLCDLDFRSSTDCMQWRTLFPEVDNAIEERGVATSAVGNGSVGLDANDVTARSMHTATFLQRSVPMTFQGWGALGFRSEGEVVIFGGSNAKNALSDLWVYNISANDFVCPTLLLDFKDASAARACEGSTAISFAPVEGYAMYFDTGTPDTRQSCKWDIDLAGRAVGHLTLRITRFDVDGDSACRDSYFRLIDGAGRERRLCGSTLRCADFTSTRWTVEYVSHSRCPSNAGVAFSVEYSAADPCSIMGTCSALHGACSGGKCCCEAGWSGTTCEVPCSRSSPTERYACAVAQPETQTEARGERVPELIHPGHRQEHSAVAVLWSSRAIVTYSCELLCPVLFAEENAIVWDDAFRLKPGGVCERMNSSQFKILGPAYVFPDFIDPRECPYTKEELLAGGGRCCFNRSTHHTHHGAYSDNSFVVRHSGVDMQNKTMKIDVTTDAHTAGELAMLVFGGWNSAPSNALWLYVHKSQMEGYTNIGVNATVDFHVMPDFPLLPEIAYWRRVIPIGMARPIARYAHTAVVMGSSHGAGGNAYRMIVFGGHSADTVLNDLWSFTLGESTDGVYRKHEWVLMNSTVPRPAKRSHHSMTVVPREHGSPMSYVFGGFDGLEVLNDLWSLEMESSDFAFGKWTKYVEPTGRWMDCRPNLIFAEFYGLTCYTVIRKSFPRRYKHTAEIITTSFGTSGPKFGLLIDGGSSQTHLPTGTNFNRFGAFGGGVSPDSFVICAENGDGYCDSPKYLAAARRSHESTHYFVLLVSLLACVRLL